MYRQLRFWANFQENEMRDGVPGSPFLSPSSLGVAATCLHPCSGCPWPPGNAHTAWSSHMALSPSSTTPQRSCLLGSTGPHIHGTKTLPLQTGLSSVSSRWRRGEGRGQEVRDGAGGTEIKEDRKGRGKGEGTGTHSGGTIRTDAEK